MSGSDGFFGWCFLVLSWNLACPSSKTCTLQLKNFPWVEDCVAIFFAHQKNNQGGAKKHPRHIYPNLLEPVMCPLLALTMYLLLFGHILSENGSLFPGNDQYIRFSKLLKQTLAQGYYNFNGARPWVYWSLFNSKGAATYASSGSTSGPSGAAVNLRIGWTLGNTHDLLIYPWSGFFRRPDLSLSYGIDCNGLFFLYHRHVTRHAVRPNHKIKTTK